MWMRVSHSLGVKVLCVCHGEGWCVMVSGCVCVCVCE